MLSARLLAELSDVAARDARAAVDPNEHDDLSSLDRPERIVTVGDWAESVYLESLSMRVWEAALLAGWGPWACPWLSDAENEQIQCDYWERILP